MVFNLMCLEAIMNTNMIFARYFNKHFAKSSGNKGENDQDEVYIKAITELYNLEELKQEVSDFNDITTDTPILKCSETLFTTYVFVDKSDLSNFGTDKVNQAFVDFFGRAAWSQYSAQFDSSEEYTISEDEFIDYAKSLVDVSVIKDF